MKAFQLANKILISLKNPYFGFVQGHYTYDENELINIENLINTSDAEIISDFEHKFSKIIGDGYSVSFASARMGFYALLKSLNVGQDDEIIIQGATCAVMVNAVFRVGAKPVYSDIDPKTFGSSAMEIAKSITSRTKMIVAQHSFGIPCDIEEIVELANSKGIFLLEDCAITLSSKINNIVCGNFGDAAIFSTDHSKPINLLIGGLVYTRKQNLYRKLILIKNSSSDLSKQKKIAIWNQILFERKYFVPDMYGKSQLKFSINKRKKSYITPFLDTDNSSIIKSNYPYPAKLPSFLALMGIREIDNWSNTVILRRKILNDFLDIISKLNQNDFSIYFDKNREIIPLRIAWAPKNGYKIRQKLSSFIDISWTWFLRPIVATDEPLINFGYNMNDCPVSEYICKDIINIPCNIPVEWTPIFMSKLIKTLSSFNE